MKLTGFDHLVLTVADISATMQFYTQVLGMTAVVDGSRHELHFGLQKINVHTRPGEFQPAARTPVAGSADFCLVTQSLMQDIVEQVSSVAPIELGPVIRTGAKGPMHSIYLRDPDGNLVEICTYENVMTERA